MIGHPTRVESRLIPTLLGLFACVAGVPQTHANAAPPAAPPATPPATSPTTQPSLITDTKIEVEKAPDVVHINGPLGTTGYHTTDREKAYLEKTPESERTIGSIVEDTTYDLGAHKGKYVSWLGIVRSVQKQEGGYELLVEHKYFDGLTDIHILALSFNGAGDFKVFVQAKAADIHPLQLVRAYGTVAEDEEKLPTLRAEYVRVFPWKTFTFLDCYGRDHSNPQWRKLCKPPLDRIYNPEPTDAYYRERLGEPAESGKPANP